MPINFITTKFFQHHQKIKREYNLTKKVNLRINDSIRYANRIQNAMMKNEEHLHKLFKDSFIFNMPKDTVTGDFYWFAQIKDSIVVAVADCTGHGIPGAFMSVLGISILNQIVVEEQNIDPSLILKRLDKKITNAFNNHMVGGERQNDGMDILVCSINYNTNTIIFAGAFSTAYLINSKNEALELKGSRYPIGGLGLEDNRLYENRILQFKKNDLLYLFSDGFSDQFGGGINKKYSRKKFRDYLISISKFNAFVQKKALDLEFKNWKNAESQTDDVMVLGIRL